jgi:hypothetical protein
MRNKILGFMLSVLLVPAAQAVSVNLAGDCTNSTAVTLTGNTLTCGSGGPTPVPVPTPPPVPPAPSFCTSADQIVTVAWPASGQVRPGTNGFVNQTVAFKITIPLTFSPALDIRHVGFAHIIEVPGTPVTSRDFTVSQNACDFQSGKYLYADISLGDTAPGVNFTINNPNFSAVGADFNLSPGDTIYMNVRNTASGGGQSCPAGGGACNVLFDFAAPNRY